MKNFLASLAIHTPARWLAAAPPAQTPLLVSLTYADVERSRHAEFMRHTWNITRAMRTQPGLRAFSVRRQLFGTKVWTMSVWDNEAALMNFLRSPAHMGAVRQVAGALQATRFWRGSLPAAQLPLRWAEALAWLQK